MDYILVACSCLFTGQISSPPELPGDLTEAQQSKLVELLELFPELYASTASVLGWAAPINEWRPEALVEVRLQGNGGIQATVEISADNIVRSLRLSGSKVPSESSDFRPMEEETTANDAFEAAVPLLTHFGLTSERDGYAVFPDPYIHPHDVAHGRWIVQHYFDFCGSPCLATEIEVEIAASTGRIVRFSFDPLVEPSNSSEGIDQKKAAQIVENWLQGEAQSFRVHHPEAAKYSLELAGAAHDQAIRVVAIPNGFYSESKPDPLVTLHSYYSWAIPVVLFKEPRSKGREVAASICVNITDGAVIGVGLPPDKIRELWPMN